MSSQASPTTPLKEALANKGGVQDCRTCNRRRIRCDRSLPSCLKCGSRSLVCPGYGPQFKWKEDAIVRVRGRPRRTGHDSLRAQNLDCHSQRPDFGYIATRQVSSLEQYRFEGPDEDLKKIITLDISAPPSSSLPDNLQRCSARELLHHYYQVLAPQLAWVDSTDNPWQNVILPLALESPPLLHSLLAMAAGDLSDRYYGCAHKTADVVFGLSRNRDRALNLLAEHLRQELAVSDGTTKDIPELNNQILASIVVLCYHEIKWPSSGLWKVHLRASGTMIRRWSTMTAPPSDITRSFLVQELSATQAMASVTSFTDTEDVLSVTFPSNHRAPFLGFCQVIQAVSHAERGGVQHSNVPIRVTKMRSLLIGLEKAKRHAFTVGQELDLRSSQARLELNLIINTYYEAGYIYTLQALSSPAETSVVMQNSRRQLRFYLSQLANTSIFAQELPWPLFIAGTECGDQVEDQQYIEKRMHEMVKLTGTLDRLKALRFLKEFWAARTQNPDITWIQIAREWAQRRESFLIW
ncbi:uncharacterized protein PAC_18676 [Phialocephala subalpina]|uniref:Zn(2)-C6 fungal-type domain-containing protein n=1 Tax=Phialocephala subalpina TaxID=576137 RepID=A0A1L7XUW5_9HELO|nr:uncharacterized protein PAC_18676 [Phialocephala subalpina]